MASRAPESPAWSRDELRENPHSHEAKANKVRSMFAAIAPSYDLNNRVHTFGIDQRWRRAAVRLAGVQPGDRVLDMACGTGDLTRLFAKQRPARVVGGDFTPEMLDIARTKRTSAEDEAIEYAHADATDLRFEDGSFDVLSIAFGIRNVSDVSRAVSEFFRVLSPGGRLVILELDRPRFAPVRWASDLYCQTIMPRSATILSGDRSGAYRYLPKSVASFLSREEMSAEISDAGFGEVSVRSLTFGLCVCYRAVKPGV